MLCGLFCVGCGLVMCCAVLCWCVGALLFGVLSCCVVGFVAGRLPLALAAPFALVLCGVLCCVWCRRALLLDLVISLVMCGVVVRCVVWPSAPLRCAALCWFCWVVLLCCPPRAASVVDRPVAVGLSLILARCCALSWGAVLCCSTVPPVVRCAVVCVFSCCVVLRCLLCAGCCLVLLRVVSGCLLLGLVVSCCLLLASFVAGVPVRPRGLLPCCVLWFAVVPCSPVLCPVVLCFRVVLCCGALLSVLLCWWCLFVLFSF